MSRHLSADQLRELHEQWTNGRSKNDIERTVLDDPASHGKAITALWRSIGLETERRHPLVHQLTAAKDRIAALEHQLRQAGLEPVQ